jgi:hypothetical protein
MSERQKGLRFMETAARAVFSLLVIFPVAAWTALALWNRAPGDLWVRSIGACAIGLVAAIAIAELMLRRRARALPAFGFAFCGVAIWFSAIPAPREGDWAREVARQTTGHIDGQILTLADVRAFDWHSADAVDESWRSRSYDLSSLTGVDLILSYWAGPQIAHCIISFGFANGEYVAWSVEVRRTRTGEYSPIADLFKSNPLVLIASDERDVMRLRSNIRGEDVQLYRLAIAPDAARALLLQFVADANSLAAQPAFFNSLTANCTMPALKMIRATQGSLDMDWRLVVNGYLPAYLYDRGLVDRELPLAELIARSRIDANALAAGDSADFSRLIRVGVPSPAGGENALNLTKR